MKPRAVPEFSAPFLAFWEMWPRKVAKLAAWKAWQSWGCDNIPELLPALKLQLPAFCQRDPEHVPHASTWLNGMRWQDEVIVRKNAPPGANGSATRPVAKAVERLPPPLRCQVHTENPRWTQRHPVDWCDGCREQKARTAGREGEPVGLDELLKGDNMPWSASK